MQFFNFKAGVKILHDKTLLKYDEFIFLPWLSPQPPPCETATLTILRIASIFCCLFFSRLSNGFSEIYRTWGIIIK